MAAKRLFAKQGFDKTTVRQICDEAGANIALVSYHFGGKENMFGALFEYFFPNDVISELDPSSYEPVNGIKLLISEVTKFRYAEPELISIIQQEILMNTERIQKIRQHVMPIWSFLYQWLEEGRAQGLFQFRSADTTFMNIISTLLFHKYSPYWGMLLKEEPPTIDALVEDLTTFIMNGLQYKEQ
ncbi:HTH-type transcriptional repressor NicS [compost metagenome]